MTTPRKSLPYHLDQLLLFLIVGIVAFGFLIFTSASLGLMARESASFESVALGQFLFGIVGGGIALFVMSSIHYRHWRQYAFYIFLATLALTAAVFIPGVGMTHGGATRWIDIGITTIQPTEFLKIGFVIYLATWLSGTARQIHDWRYGLAPLGACLGAIGLIVLQQPDTDTFLIMAAGGLTMFFVAGASWRHLLLIAVMGVAGLALIAFMRPYVLDRITTFMNPDADPLSSGYQIQQSLIAIGSGGVTGRGFGQSIQKFDYLPEPIGDSIFAVYAEEFGFLGSIVLLGALVALGLRGYKTAVQAKDLFGTLLVTGFITMLLLQAFLNIAAMTGLAPLSGLPLPLISHGGTALVSTLAALGIVLNASKYRRRGRIA